MLRDVDDLISVGRRLLRRRGPHRRSTWTIGLQLAEAGIHTLIEKPLAHDAPSARKLVEAFAERGLVGAVGHIERYNAALQSARKRLENGDLGTVYQIITRRQGPFPGRIADVGVVKDLATHDIDLTAWVSQQPFTSVSARTAFRSGRQHEDLVAVVGSLADGTITNHLVNWLSPLKERVTIMTGERGTFVADTLTADLTFYANGSVPTTWGGIAAVPRGVRRRHDPLCHPQARAAAAGAREFPGRSPRSPGRHRHDGAGIDNGGGCRGDDRVGRHRHDGRSASFLVRITVVGLGKIGLPLAVQFAGRGHQVIGADINPRGGRPGQPGRGAVPRGGTAGREVGRGGLRRAADRHDRHRGRGC